MLIPGVGGEVWGLDTHPSRNEFVTGSDDKLIKIWDMNERFVGSNVMLADHVIFFVI